jgi:hypothetical protein
MPMRPVFARQVFDKKRAIPRMVRLVDFTQTKLHQLSDCHGLCEALLMSAELGA